MPGVGGGAIGVSVGGGGFVGATVGVGVGVRVAGGRVGVAGAVVGVATGRGGVGLSGATVTTSVGLGVNGAKVRGATLGVAGATLGVASTTLAEGEGTGVDVHATSPASSAAAARKVMRTVATMARDASEHHHAVGARLAPGFQSGEDMARMSFSCSALQAR